MSFLIWLKARNLWKKSSVLFFPVHCVIELSGDLSPNLVISTRGLRAVMEVHSLGMQKADVDHGNCFRQSFSVIFWILSQIRCESNTLLKGLLLHFKGSIWALSELRTCLWSLARLCFVLGISVSWLGVCHF